MEEVKGRQWTKEEVHCVNYYLKNRYKLNGCQEKDYHNIEVYARRHINDFEEGLLTWSKPFGKYRVAEVRFKDNAEHYYLLERHGKHLIFQCDVTHWYHQP